MTKEQIKKAVCGVLGKADIKYSDQINLDSMEIMATCVAMEKIGVNLSFQDFNELKTYGELEDMIWVKT